MRALDFRNAHPRFVKFRALHARVDVFFKGSTTTGADCSVTKRQTSPDASVGETRRTGIACGVAILDGQANTSRVRHLDDLAHLRARR